MARTGRPSKPYHTSWREIIPGLYRCPDGRWRIVATGAKFTEADERRAVQRFHEMTGKDRPMVTLPITTTAPDFDAMGTAGEALIAAIDTDITEDGQVAFVQRMPEAKMWVWMRQQLIARPEYVARMVGIPELANLRHLPLPKASIKLTDLITAYKQENPSTNKSKREALAVFNRLTKFADAKTLDDLTQERLLDFRRHIEDLDSLSSPATRKAYYGRIKTIVSFGLKVGMDQVQLRAALDRCKVLWTGEALPPVQPQPISREHFHTLLAAGNGTWRVWLLLALNLCMTVEDLCELRWSDFNLTKGTFAAIRVKTRRDRIPRAGVLWSETIAALGQLKRKGEYVFTSSHGTRFNKNGRVNDFAELREAAGVPDSVKFNHIRDGAYTTACQATHDERWARVLAGHRAAGLQDNYVLRNPEAVRSACEAVYRAFGPFPS